MRWILGISVTLLLLAGGDAMALHAPAPASTLQLHLQDAVVLAADKVSLEEAVRRVRKQYGGRIISAETRGSGNGRVHVIKVLTDEGRVQTVRIRAN